MIKIVLDAEVVFGSFFEGFLVIFSEFPKRANLENQAKTMEGWSKMHFPMWRIRRKVNQTIVNFETLFDSKKHAKLKIFFKK